MSIPFYQVDAFTDQPFAGNPAGVCLLPGPKGDAWMQNVAAEMNLPETAFLLKQEDGYSLRWFAPQSEVPLCGHATLASAYVLWATGQLAASVEARFHTKSGLLTAVKNGDWIELNFPAEKATPCVAPVFLPEALGCDFVYVGRNRMDYLVEVASEEELKSLAPDMNLLMKVDTRGVIVTCRAKTKPYDFMSRFFCPLLGVPEDPVTGSSHCCLAPYWQQKLGKDEFAAFQASPRGGVLRVRVESGGRVAISGQAVVVLKAELFS
ncbi:MAG TPA: PhzF family phenazine biosynthesis protein [Bacilli bacterium]